jgi:hypothetical protein
MRVVGGAADPDGGNVARLEEALRSAIRAV